MIFFFKKSKLHVDAFISEQYAAVFETAPIKYSHHYYPDWWRNLSKNEFDFDKMTTPTTAKSCIAIIEYYNKGITIPMWSDFALKSNGVEIVHQFSDTISELVWHHPEQRKGFRMDQHHFKLTSPWWIKSEKDVYFNFLPDFYNLNRNDLQIIPGTIDYYYQHSTNINFLVPSGQGQMFIPFGQPLVNIVPLSERELVLSNHLISDAEASKIKAKHRPIMFSKKAVNFKKYSKANDTAKCPIHFWK